MADSIYTQASDWGDSREMQQRVTAAWVQQGRLGLSAAPPMVDPLTEVIKHRWIWSSEWGTIDDVTGVSDGQIRDAVKALWPLPEEPLVE